MILKVLSAIQQKTILIRPLTMKAFLCADREAAPNSSDSFTVTGLDNGTKYNFSAFTYDESGNYSETAHVSATPAADPNPPTPPTGLEIVEP